MKPTLVLALGFLVGACAIPDPGSDSATIARTDDCGTWGCGTNSATVGDGLLFDELDSAGSRNAYGLYIVGTTAPDGRAAHLSVERHAIVVTTFDGSRFDGPLLVGTVIHLRHDVYGDYELLIAEVLPNTLKFWAGAADDVPAYQFLARKDKETQFTQYACKYDVLTTDPTWSGVEHSAVVFQWDRYDPVHKLVRETDPADTWFNIACAATAPAKMHLMRHTRAGSYSGGVVAYDTAVGQRQAMLKMFTADYCGTGQSFTVDGVPLVYRDANHWYPYYPYSGQEALWTETGALCLDQPRYVAKSTVDAACGRPLPACPSFTGPWWGWEAWAYVMSAKPVR